MDVLPLLAAFTRCLFTLLKRVDYSDSRWAKVQAELEWGGYDHAAICCGHFVAARETDLGSLFRVLQGVCKRCLHWYILIYYDYFLSLGLADGLVNLFVSQKWMR